MPHRPPDRIRNVALVGHRGSGKTSLAEAILFESGVVNRLGRVEDGSTVCDFEDDEQERGMSIGAAVTSFEHDGRKVNMIDTPGESSFIADTLAALRVVDAAVFVVNGVMGVEVHTERLWRRADEEGLARLVFVNMLDRERADFFRTLDSLKAAFGQHVVATEIPIGSEHQVRGVIDLIDMTAFEYEGEDRGNSKQVEIPEELRAQAEEYREKLMDEVAENSDELMERYLEGEEISHAEIVAALKKGVTEGHLFPVTCGVATHNLGTNRLLEALVEDLPSPAMRGAVAALDSDGERVDVEPDESGELLAYVFKTTADPYTGRINMLRVYSGELRSDSHVQNAVRRSKERIGQLAAPEGKEMAPIDELGPGDIGAVAKLRETRAGDVLAPKDTPIRFPPLDLPAPVMAFAYEPKSKGDEEKAASAIRRLTEEDPTLDVHRDPETGEQIIAGLSQIHVEVIVDRMKRRFGAEIELHPPRVPYIETIRKPAKAHGRYKKQTGGRGQFGDCRIEIEPQEAGEGFEFVNAIKGGVIPGGFIPAVEKGIVEAMAGGVLAGYPMKDLRVRLYDGQHHSVDSSEMAFKIAGSMAFKQAVADADACLLEPIMQMTIAVPEDSVGDVIGDLNSRRGRPLGMEPKGSATEIKAEVPLA
ncbi:MAG: elongation factor G, partial [Solirubrobacterales bacterium]